MTERIKAHWARLDASVKRWILGGGLAALLALGAGVTAAVAQPRGGRPAPAAGPRAAVPPPAAADAAQPEPPRELSRNEDNDLDGWPDDIDGDDTSRAVVEWRADRFADGAYSDRGPDWFEGASWAGGELGAEAWRSSGGAPEGFHALFLEVDRLPLRGSDLALEIRGRVSGAGTVSVNVSDGVDHRRLGAASRSSPHPTGPWISAWTSPGARWTGPWP